MKAPGDVLCQPDELAAFGGPVEEPGVETDPNPVVGWFADMEPKLPAFLLNPTPKAGAGEPKVLLLLVPAPVFPRFSQPDPPAAFWEEKVALSDLAACEQA